MKLTVTRGEAAQMLSMSLSHFQRHVLPELKTVYVGRRRYVRVSDLEAWLERQS